MQARVDMEVLGGHDVVIVGVRDMIVDRLCELSAAGDREGGTDELLAYYLYGHSLACSYAGLYPEARGFNTIRPARV